jgi:hypothetical protein
MPADDRLTERATPAPEVAARAGPWPNGGTMGVTATLLLSCPDAKGVVAGVAELVYRHGGNIVHADQHTDREQGVFLQRAISRPAFSSAR